MKFSEFLGECRENDVFKNLSIYVVSSWVLLQVISLLADPLNLPKATLTVLLIILLVGFPLYTFFIWHYQIKPDFYEEASMAEKNAHAYGASAKDGIELDPVFSNTGVHNRSSISKFQKMYFIGVGVMGTLSLLASFFIIRTNFLKTETAVVLPAFLHSEVGEKIAILKFDNNTADENLDVVGKMAVDWIMHGITQNKVAQVISPKIIEDYSNVLKASFLSSGDKKGITEYLKPSKVIVGSFYLRGQKLLFQSSISDEHMDKTLIAFTPVECDADKPLDCIEALSQRIMGFLATEDQPLENLQESPPNYEAFQYLDQAEANYDNDEEYLRLITASMNADSTFFEPKVKYLEYFYNKGDYRVADSLVSVLSKKANSNKRQSNLLKMYGSLIAGNNRDTYKYLLNEYEIYPFDFETNASTMTVALQFVNRPQDVIPIFGEVSMDNIDLNDCVQCEYRYYIKGLADIELGNYQDAITMLSPFAKTNGQVLLKEVLLKAKILTQSPATEIDEILKTYKLSGNINEWRQLCLKTALNYLFLENSDQAFTYLDAVIDSNKNALKEMTDNELRTLGYAHFHKGEFATAERLFKEYIDRNPEQRRVNYLGILAITYLKNNKPQQALKMLDAIEKRRGDYKYGHIDYTYAQYYAVLGEEDKALKHLLKATADGKWYTPDAYQHDLFLKPLKDKKIFQDILDFWK